MIIGLGVYYGYSKQKEAEQIEEETPTVVTERVPSEADNQIVVPIANPESAPQLMRTATDIARDRNGEILVMSIVTVPQQTPLSEGRKFIDDQRDVLNEAMAIAEDAGRPRQRDDSHRSRRGEGHPQHRRTVRQRRRAHGLEGTAQEPTA